MLFTQPIIAHFESNYCNECFTDSSVYDLQPQNVERHIHQRLDVANGFMGISLPYNYFPKDKDEFICLFYHSEQALIVWDCEIITILEGLFWIFIQNIMFVNFVKCIYLECNRLKIRRGGFHWFKKY